jgi:hypothetical protein
MWSIYSLDGVTYLPNLTIDARDHIMAVLDRQVYYSVEESEMETGANIKLRECAVNWANNFKIGMAGEGRRRRVKYAYKRMEKMDGE